jgi:plastocyanin
MRRLLLLSVVLLASACSGGGDGSAGAVEMTDGQQFSPASLTVAPGTTVTFSNASSQAHTVTARGDAPSYFSSGGFDSEEAARENLAEALVGQEGTYEVTLDEPGTYEYFCIPHEDQGMTGTIVVEEE